MKQLNRRWIALSVAVVASLTLASCSSSSNGAAVTATAGNLGTLKVQNVWVDGDTSLAGVWEAQNKGYFTDAGLTVDVAAGGDVDPTQLVLGGAADVGFNSATTLLAARSKGAPIKILGCVFQSSPLAIIANADAGINTFADLKGKTIGTDPTTQPALKAWLGANGMTEDDVTITTIAAGLGQFTAKQVDAQTAYATSEGLSLQAQNYPFTMLLAGDTNFTTPDYCLFTTEQGVSEHGAQIKAFLAAASRGYADSKTDPTGAAAIVSALQTGADSSAVEKEIALDNDKFIQANGHPVFGVTDAEFDALSDKLVASGYLDTGVKGSDILDLSLLP